MNNFPKRKPIRLKNYDYSKAGCYFVTICTNDRKYIFGNIENDEMILNQCGKIVKNIWLEIPKHFQNIELDTYIVMPNHIHGVIIIKNPVGDGPARPVNKSKTTNNLSNIIGSFKSAVTKQINQLNDIPFKWQRFFYDHIIRTEESLNSIREYVVNNPATWDNDENNVNN